MQTEFRPQECDQANPEPQPRKKHWRRGTECESSELFLDVLPEWSAAYPTWNEYEQPSETSWAQSNVSRRIAYESCVVGPPVWPGQACHEAAAFGLACYTVVGLSISE